NGLLTPPIALTALLALLWCATGIVRGAAAETCVAAVCLVAVLPYLVVSTSWYPRYLVVSLVPLCLVVARLLAQLAGVVAGHAPEPRRVWRGAVAALCLLPLAAFAVPRDVELLVEPQNAALPAADRAQYVSEWTSGYGLPELVAFLQHEAEAGEINVVRLDV